LSTDQTRRVRFGLVGCGRIGASTDDRASSWPTAPLWVPYSHASAISSSKEAELVAVCDVRPEAAAAAAASFRVPSTYTELSAMLATERLDALAIATRTAERADIIQRAAEAGVRGVYCEKPLATTLEVADQLRNVLESRAVAFSYGTKRRFMPVHHATRSAVAAGEIGELETITLRLGNGLLMWTQPHAVDLACFYANDAAILSVQADLDLPAAAVSGNVVDADPTVRMACIRFASGLVAHLIPGGAFDVELSGARGNIVVRNDGLVSHTRRPAPGTAYFLGETIVPTWGRSSGPTIAICLL
jgi:predicted dehydrogenase